MEAIMKATVISSIVPFSVHILDVMEQSVVEFKNDTLKKQVIFAQQKNGKHGDT